MTKKTGIQYSPHLYQSCLSSKQPQKVSGGIGGDRLEHEIVKESILKKRLEHQVIAVQTPEDDDR